MKLTIVDDKRPERRAPTQELPNSIRRKELVRHTPSQIPVRRIPPQEQTLVRTPYDPCAPYSMTTVGSVCFATRAYVAAARMITVCRTPTIRQEILRRKRVRTCGLSEGDEGSHRSKKYESNRERSFHPKWKRVRSRCELT